MNICISLHISLQLFRRLQTSSWFYSSWPANFGHFHNFQSRQASDEHDNAGVPPRVFNRAGTKYFAVVQSCIILPAERFEFVTEWTSQKGVYLNQMFPMLEVYSIFLVSNFRRVADIYRLPFTSVYAILYNPMPKPCQTAKSTAKPLASFASPRLRNAESLLTLWRLSMALLIFEDVWRHKDADLGGCSETQSNLKLPIAIATPTWE